MMTFKEYLRYQTLVEYPDCLQILTRKDIAEMAQEWQNKYGYEKLITDGDNK